MMHWGPFGWFFGSAFGAVGFLVSLAVFFLPTIIAVAQKVPEEALQEDEKLLLWYDQALTRMEEK